MILATLRMKKTKGVEYYLARLTFNGKRYEKSLGHVSSMTKDEVIKLLRTVKPSPSSGSIKENLSEKVCPAFGDVLESIEKVKRWKKTKCYQQWHQSPNGYAMPTAPMVRFVQA